MKYLLHKLWFFIMIRLVPDYIYLLYRYYRITGRYLNLRNPRTLNEKIQWGKLYDRREIYTTIADKCDVRRYVATIVGEKYLIPIFGIYESLPEFIDGPKPPWPFIVKPTHDSGGGVIVRNPLEFDFNKIYLALNKRMMANYYHSTKEWQYKNIIPRVIVEKLLICRNGKLPNDYKFNCFNGRCEFVYCSIDREGANYRKIYNRNWQPIAMTWCAPGMEEEKFKGLDIPPPENYLQMLEVAEALSAEFKYIRVDLYNVDGHIFFGELTQHHGGGFELIKPEHLDCYYGSLVDM